ncbi:MAG: membrane protein insertion efficiency factor YidD [Candidatus Binatus sp.]|uniref:membrane protein insertion efficiency factor YidD n=1 Tax=Candidatus Binatus sp. TaxID=2811406 RepID=UPI0027252E26|nr:membrane protein insertion efficiency factor YidD [Candidatus Binatus sp.]MDO8432299.1 membrane protein insertion efficiency factor YidD [Candidatus Binatus sp.]
MKTRGSIASIPLTRAARYPALGAIAIYRGAISPMIQALFGRACRFEPSCSEYAAGAIREYGLIRGGARAAWRIARCNPLGGDGYDPAPARRSHIEAAPDAESQTYNSSARD